MGQQSGSLQDLGDHKKLEEKYFIQKVKLGQGSYGNVWRAVDRETNRIVAVKQMERAKIQRSGIKPEDVRREIAVLRACNHESIIRLFDAYKDAAGTIYMALEYCEGGDFGDKVRERSETLQEFEVADWMHQILSAIAYLHDRRVCHRDIKPDNFMVGLNGEQANRLKLADFGLAIPVAPGQLLTERCGTPAFMSPEQHTLPPKGRSRGYGCPVDVWAAGLTMYCLLFRGQHPFLSSRGFFDEKAAMEGKLSFQDPGVSNGFFNAVGLGGKNRDRWSAEPMDLCKKLVETKPSQRIPAGHALRHAFLSKVPKNRGSPGKGEAASSVDIPDKATDSGSIPLQVHDKAVADYISQGLNWISGLLAPYPPAVNMAKENADLRSQLQDRVAEAQALAQSGFPLPEGTACRYLSASVGRWVPAVALRYNGSTYDLDKKYAAPLDRISPPWDGSKPVAAADAWPAGTAVAVDEREKQNDGWTASKTTNISAVIRRFNPDDGTYDLDVRPRVPVGQLRPRKVPPLKDGISEDGDDLRTNKRHTATMKPRDTQLGNSALATGTASKGLLTRGVSCEFQVRARQSEWITATIEHYNEDDGSYCVVSKSSYVERAPLDRIRPSVNGIGTSWPAGSRVSYESASMKVWLPAVVGGYNESDKTYDLDIRPHADPERMRPRPSPERDFLDSERPNDASVSQITADATAKEARHRKIECSFCGRSFWRQQSQQGRSAICPPCRKDLKGVDENDRRTTQL